MKTKIPIILFLLFNLSNVNESLGQNRRVGNSNSYNDYINNIQSTGNEVNRFNAALNYVSMELLSSAQLTTILRYIHGDQNKFSIGVRAYPNVIDKENFFLVYDCFARFSWAIRLYHFTQGNQEPIHIEPVCSTNTNEFDYIKSSIKDQIFNDKQIEMAKNHIQQRCLTIEQMKELCTIFSLDNYKLELIKFMFDYTDQPQRFYEFKDLLTFKSTQRDLDQFLVSRD